ncbi:hypothetical protein JG687_00005970 [Phytophthora cactorum]|uniref:Uncharacterized protein n=1 Tax=Phytophthora cactorum TaxID=29920 RepID=A0A329S8R7_9STRA|nr:hypothetical protein Pcac1_g5971 [Phytophthora cactorum]KAG2929868.1 hypothetical protein PC114_g2612 [Phytophthora cactorum]KAG2954342.1 hypothetical protein PC117_g1309 [Phytophthora cactorum]KAG3200247.1 hypothetical protein PC128_g4712 [Phytophthora cactorum]KAG3226563.1 hypothetical protein PC129_g2839 [Phytophthora cactorum]
MLLLSILLIAVTSTSYTRPVLATSSLAAKPNGTRLNATDYWVQDEPYKFQPRWTRLSDGKVVASNDSNFSNFAEYRGAIEAKTPWISKWVLSTEGRRTLKKDIPRLLMYNLVSPMDYGKSVRSGNVRRRRNKAIGMFLTDNLALPLVKSLGRVAWNLIQSHYVGYFEDEMFAQHLKMMNASEMIKEFNLTLPIDAIENAQEESRPNATLSYVYDGESKRSVLYARYTAAFVPYKGYPDRGDSSPLHVFEKHMNERVPILDEVVSYYADTNHDTKISMELNRSIPMLDKFEESELVQLTNSVESQMKILDRSIVSYVQTRATNPLYQEVVNATKRGDFYNGSEYTLVGFGFVVPATNDKNVLYRDMKLPVPFHLVLRLIVRFQESRLLLPQESRQLLVCLAMAFYNLSFYRCRPALTQ